MSNLVPFLPQDRVASLAEGVPLPSTAHGAVLFADVSGFSALTNALVDALGRRRGAEAATRMLNRIYSALLTHVHGRRGYVISFNGDGVLCWFPANGEGVRDAALTSVSCARAMVKELEAFRDVAVAEGVTANLGVKVAVASGKVRRMLAGDPAIQRLEVLAGRAVDRVGLAERLARSGEVVVDEDTITLLREVLRVLEWREEDSAGERFAVVERFGSTASGSKYEDTASWSDSVTVDPEMLKQWVLPAVYERLASGQEQYLAELRPCVALFGRFVGLDYDNDADAASKLDGYVTWVQQTVDRHGGALIQLTTGDKGSYFYAAFGAPVQRGDEATRAAAAALDLRLPPEGLLFRPRAQIGLARGRMRVGAYGSDFRRTYGVQGSAVNLAARIMMLAQPGAALVTADLSDDLSLRFRCGPEQVEAVKGSERPVSIRKLIDRNEVWANSGRAAQTADLYGREPEISLMDQAVTRLYEGHGQLVRVHGPAGIGKSRLVSYMVEDLRRQDATVLGGACESAETNFAYYAVRPLLVQLLGLHLQREITSDAVWEAIRNAIPDPDPMWRTQRAPGISLLGDMLGATMQEERTTRSLGAQLRQEILVGMIVDMIVRAAQTSAIAVTVEDVQWADEASQAVLLALARATQFAPLLVIYDHRPAQEDSPFLHELAQQSGQLDLAVGPLEQVAVGRLLEGKLGGAAFPLLASFVLRHAQGNPFFTAELVDSLLETGQLVSADGVWTLDEHLRARLLQAGCLVNVDGEWQLSDDADIAAANLGVPDTVQETVLARADRLSSDVRLTLRVASVAGRSFGADLVAEAHPAGLGDEEVLRHLNTLAQREFIVVGIAGRSEFGFRHSITQEAVYGSMLERQLHDLHLAVARVVERERPADVEGIAYHYARADVRQTDVRGKAMHYLQAAANRAKREYANETALSLFDQALALDQRWEWLRAKTEVLHILGLRDEERAALKTLENAEEAPDAAVAFAWADYHDAVSEYPAALQRVSSVLQTARQASDELAAARAHLRAGAILRHQGILDRAEAEYLRARDLLTKTSGTSIDVADARFGLGAVYRDQGNLELADDYLRQALSSYRHAGARAQEALTLDLLGFMQLLRHRHDESLALQRQSLELSRTIGDRAGEARSLMSMAQALRGLGDFSQAEQVLCSCLKIQRRLADVFLQVRTNNELGIVFFLCGQYDRSVSILEETVEMCKQIGDEKMLAFSVANLGQALRDWGRLDEAETVLQKSLMSMRELGYRYNEAGNISDLAMLFIYAGRYEHAAEAAEKSLAKFRELQAVLSTTTDLATLAEAHRRMGRISQAEAYADSALDILHACDGSGPDYPQRDYHLSALALLAAGRQEDGERALERASEILLEQSERISDPDVRDSFLQNVPHNRELVHDITRRGLSLAPSIQ